MGYKSLYKPEDPSWIPETHEELGGRTNSTKLSCAPTSHTVIMNEETQVQLHEHASGKMLGTLGEIPISPNLPGHW